MGDGLNQQFLNSTFAARTAVLFHSNNDNHTGKFLIDFSILQSKTGYNHITTKETFIYRSDTACATSPLGTSCKLPHADGSPARLARHVQIERPEKMRHDQNTNKQQSQIQTCGNDRHSARAS
jgi:hypothetical protein